MAATFTRGASSIKLTETGKRKIARAQKAVLRGMKAGLLATIPEYKRRLARASPSATEEAQLLSVGEVTSVRSAAAGGIVGTPAGGRFQRRSPMMSLRNAIAESEVTTKTTGDRISVTTCRAAELNAKTGFSWRTRKRGIQGPTKPFYARYVQALNDGGVWVVFPRTPALLNPQPGVLVTEITKTLQPRQMFQTARAGIRDKMRANVDKAVKQELQTLRGA
jgi:hypothetical protein